MSFNHVKDTCSLLAVLIASHSFVPSSAMALDNPSQTRGEARCIAAVEGKIAWNYKGNKNWNLANVRRLCAGAPILPRRSQEPAKCFEHVMHGGVSWGRGTRWEWGNAINLCKGTKNAFATVSCFSNEINHGNAWDKAIAKCRENSQTASRVALTSRGLVRKAHTKDTNRCAVNVKAQLGRGGLRLGQIKKTHQFNVNGTFGGIRVKNRRGHVQGIARLRDWKNQGRMVLSENVSGAGFQIGFQPITAAREGAFSKSIGITNGGATDIINQYPHPGGMQVQGDYVVVGMQDGPAHAPAAFTILKADGQNVQVVSERSFSGNEGEPGLAQYPAKAGAAALGRMENGHYLIAVYDDGDRGKQHIRFYASTKPTINSTTRWNYEGRYSSTCRYGDDSCINGGQGGLSFVTDCNGDMYLVVMDGQGETGGKDYHWYQLFQVTVKGRKISLQKIYEQDASVGRRVTRASSFRWGGATYIDQSGKVHLLSVDRQPGPSIVRADKGNAVGVMHRYVD